MKYLILIMVLATPVLTAQRIDPLEIEPKRLKDVDTEGKTKEQIKADRIKAFKIANTERAKKDHRDQAKADHEADKDRKGKPVSGRRPGQRVRLVWANTAAFEAWQADYEGIPGIGDSFAIYIRAAASEFPGDDVIPPSGRSYTEIKASAADQAWLEANGVILTEAGSFDPIQEEENP